MGSCVLGAVFNMRADILRQGVDDPGTTGVDESHWVLRQDPNSGEILRVWEENDAVGQTVSPTSTLESFPCAARGIVDGGIRVAGTTERFSEEYEGVDYVRMKFPSKTKINRRDRITNIRDKKGKILWIEEERTDLAPTVFSVVGVTPIIDPFGNHVENMALLERAETQ